MADFEFVLAGAYVGILDCDSVLAGSYAAGYREFVLAGAYQAGDTVEPPILDFIPSGLEALQHRVFNTTVIRPEIFGELVTFMDGEGNQFPRMAVIEFDQGQQRLDEDGRRRTRSGTVYVSYDPIIGLAAIDWRYTFTARGETFAIKDPDERQGGCWSCRFVRTESQEKTQLRRVRN